jgi:choline dehydrogenase-like flavoprotein
MTPQTFDYVIVGAGSAGCVLAARLSEDPNVTVCLLEAGGPDKSVLIHAPAGVVAMVPTRINNYAYETVPQPGLNGRKGYQPRGRTLGGSSSINAMLYVRGNRWDYDHWAALGNPGWSYDDVLPLFKRSEHNEQFADGFHGQGGPAERDLPGAPEPGERPVPASGRRQRHSAEPGLQRRGASGVVPVPGHAQERRALQRGQSLPDAQPVAAQPQGHHPRGVGQGDAGGAGAPPAWPTTRAAPCRRCRRGAR